LLGDTGGEGECNCLAVKNGAWVQISAGAEGTVTGGEIKPCLVSPVCPQEGGAACHLPTRDVLPAPRFWGSCQAGEKLKSLLGGRGEAAQRCPCCPPPAALGQCWAELVLHRHRLLLLSR